MKKFLSAVILSLGVLSGPAIAGPFDTGNPITIFQPVGGSGGGGGGSGCVPVGASGNALVDSGAGTCSSDSLANFVSGALTLGTSGTLGKITFGNATSGTVTLQPTTGALGTVTLSMPAVTDTLAGIAATQTLTNKTISGSSNTLSNIANASLTNSSMTLAGHVVPLGGTQTFACADLSNGASGCSQNLATWAGSSSITTLGTIATGTWNGTKIGLAFGGTNVDLSATGGTHQVLRQSTLGGNVTVSQLACADLSDAGSGCSGSGGGGTPGGSNTQIQYNNSGAFGGISGLTTNGTIATFADGALNLTGASSGTAILKAPATSGGTLTFPTGTDTIASIAATQTLTNKTISGSSNTLTNIANGSLTNSSITIAGHSVALGGSQAIACADLSTSTAACSTAIGTNGAVLPLLSTDNTWGGVQTFTNTRLALLGSSTGSTNFTSDNSGATVFTVHVPAANDTIAVLATAQTLTNKTISGSSNTLTNIDNSSLVNSSTIVNGQTCALGGSCSITAVATGIAVGTTTISSGTTNGLLYDNAGVLGNLATVNSGVLVTSGAGAPSISTTLPNGLALGVPGSVTLTNGTGLPISTGVSGLGTGIATFLGTPSSANLAAAVTDETGSGALVFASSPTLVNPTLGAATATSINKVAITAPASSATLTIANAKTLIVSNSLTLAGTDSTVMTFPATSKTIAANDLSNVTLSGDCTNSSAAVTCLKTNGTSFGPYATATLGQLPGATSNSPASLGNIGEPLSSTVTFSSAVSMSSGVGKDLTSKSFTAGNWMIWGSCWFSGTATTVVSYTACSLSTTLNTLQGDGTTNLSGTVYSSGTTPFATDSIHYGVGSIIVSLSSPITYHLVGQSAFATSTEVGYGTIQGVRIN